MKIKILLTLILAISAIVVLNFNTSASALTVKNAGIESKTFGLQSTSTACNAISQLNPDQNCGTGESTITKVIKAAVEILSFVVGAAAIIMVIISGFRFITSGGDSNRVSSARSALIYALIGIAVVALAQFLVHFVLNNTSHALH